MSWNKRSLLLFLAGLAVVAGTCTVAFWRLRDASRQRINEELLLDNKIIEAAVSPSRLLALKGDASDRQSEDYRRIREQLEVLKNRLSATAELRGIYIMRTAGDRLQFSVDSAPEGDPWHSEPGVTYVNPPQALRSVVSGAKDAVAGPYNDEYGGFYSAFSAVRYEGHTIAYVGTDIDLASYDHMLREKLLSPIVLLFCLVLLYVLLFSVIERRLRASEELRKANARLRNTIEGTNAGTWEWNLRKDRFLVNERWAAIAGFSTEELLPLSAEKVRSFIHPDDLMGYLEALQDHLDGRTEYFTFEGRVRRRNGAWLWVYESGKVVEWEDEVNRRPLKMFGTRLDIDALKKANEVLDRLAAIVRFSTDAIIGKDLLGIVTEWNEEAEHLYGFSAAEAVGQSIEIIVPPDRIKEAQDIQHRAAAGQKIEHFRTVRRKKNGDLVDVSLAVAPIKDATGRVTGVSTIAHDITKEMMIERSKDEFVSLAAHQLKTPVGALNWNIEMLLDGDYGELRAEQKEALTEMHSLGVRMNDLVNSFLNISRIDLGTLSIDPVPTDLAALCDEVVKEMEPRRDAKGHALSRAYDEGLPIVEVDPKLVRVVFQNYLSNAIKYTPDHGKVSLGLHVIGTDVVFSVANSGEPIADAEKPRIFQKLFRASNAREMDPDGNGLGLYLVKKIVESTGGRAWFSSNRGEDTVFFAAFPLAGMPRRQGLTTLS